MNAGAPNPQPSDFRGYLQIELLRRCKANRSYSLRAYAKALQVEPSVLSKILNGKRQITAEMYERLAKRLELSPAEQRRFHPVAQKARALESKTSKPSKVAYRDLSLDLFQVIADWYHYAILELVSVEGFEPTPRWIARSLGITVLEVNMAVERLRSLGFLRVDEAGKWHDDSGAVTTVGNHFTAAAFRKLQRQVLEMAIEAIEEIPMEARDQSSMTMAVSSRLLPEAKERIKAFRRELCLFLQSDSKRDQVYHLGISLYPVSKNQKGNPS